MLKTKCILLEKELGDGYRISTMSRHTLNDGVTPDPRISETSYDVWMPKLAAPSKLVGAWYRNAVTWTEFSRAYLSHLRQTEIREQVDIITSAPRTAGGCSRLANVE